MVGKQCEVIQLQGAYREDIRSNSKYGLTFTDLETEMHACNKVSDAAGASLDLSKKRIVRRRSTSQPPIRCEILSDHVQIIPINIQPDSNSTKKNLTHEPSISRILINSPKPIIPDKPKNLHFLTKKLQEAKYPAPLISQSKWVKNSPYKIYIYQNVSFKTRRYSDNLSTRTVNDVQFEILRLLSQKQDLQR